MFELTGTIKELAVISKTKQAFLSLAVNENHIAQALVDDLDGKKLSIQVSEYFEKRSKDANSYMWSLCRKLAEKLNAEGGKYTKDDIYRDAIKEVGVWYDDEVEPEKVSRRRTAWELIGTGWVTERVDFTADGEKEIIRFYYGSSRYNKKQMSRLIDNIVQDCKAAGIDTRTPDEIASMLSLWGEGE